ncbi:MAG: MFS transporter [Gemmatales bacterium]|nr:MFS transporter [Gemmatales bacterium]MDW8385793.1 MFS transporter [Gemmatales bacterium]
MKLLAWPRRWAWINRTVLGIVLATFFSDVSHEMATAVLPFYLAGIGLGAFALGLIEGTADFLVSISKLAGGYVGHHVQHKKPWAALGYLVTTLGTFGIALVGSLAAVLSLRCAAWVGRGFRSPLRDFLLADAVEPTHYGRAYGLERAGDMLGAVMGPFLAALLLWGGWEFRSIILWTALPGLAAASLFFFLTRERPVSSHSDSDPPKLSTVAALVRFPRMFWLFLIGVTVFGLGDFSRTFIVFLAAEALGETKTALPQALSVAVVLYMVHNLVSAMSAYPVGWLGDRRSKMPILVGGYGLGAFTNLLLALHGQALAILIPAIVLSGFYISVEETLEKAVAADLLPRELRSLGFGILACCNAVGDMASSFYVGYLLQAGYPAAAFGIAASVGGLGFVWMLALLRRASRVSGS